MTETPVKGLLNERQYDLLKRAAEMEDKSVKQFVIEAAMSSVSWRLVDPKMTDRKANGIDERQDMLTGIVEDAGTIPPAELYATYVEEVGDIEGCKPVSKRTIRKDMSQLAERGKILATGRGKARIYSTPQR